MSFTYYRIPTSSASQSKIWLWLFLVIFIWIFHSKGCRSRDSLLTIQLTKNWINFLHFSKQYGSWDKCFERKETRKNAGSCMQHNQDITSLGFHLRLLDSKSETFCWKSVGTCNRIIWSPTFWRESSNVCHVNWELETSHKWHDVFLTQAVQTVLKCRFLIVKIQNIGRKKWSQLADS